MMRDGNGLKAVSIIILTRNTCALTRTALQSISPGDNSLAQEIIVVDNGSTDDTPTALPREFPGINLIRSERNLGFAAAVNLAAKSATGEFLLLLNSDARPEAHALKQAVAQMRAHPDWAVAGAQLLNADGSRQNSIANFPTLATELLNKSLLRRIFPDRFPGKEHQFTTPTNIETVIGAFMLIRKTTWDALAGLDERFFFFFEETDFCLRVRRIGQRVVHLPDVLVRHEQGATAKTVSTAARIEYWRSRYRYFQKNHGLGTRIVLAAGLGLRLLIDGVVALGIFLLTGGSSPRWRNRWSVCRALWSWHLRGLPDDAGLPR